MCTRVWDLQECIISHKVATSFCTDAQKELEIYFILGTYKWIGYPGKDWTENNGYNSRGGSWFKTKKSFFEIKQSKSFYGEFELNFSLKI